MMYSGNSQSSGNTAESTGRHHQHHQSVNSSLSHSNQNNNPADENTVMSMKKSAEIAAIFSGKNINQRTDIADHNLSTEQDDFVEVDRYRHQFSESNMHSSLGYLP